MERLSVKKHELVLGFGGIMGFDRSQLEGKRVFLLSLLVNDVSWPSSPQPPWVVGRAVVPNDTLR
jgi:hypothetical protein